MSIPIKRRKTPSPSAPVRTGVSPVLGATSPSEEFAFAEELAFLKQHTDIILLGNGQGAAQVALAPAWQGRVMTSTAQGPSGRSLGWLNRERIASEKRVPHMNIFGGEEWFWIGPEGSRYSIFHKGKINWESWQVPPPLDTLPFKLVRHSSDKAVFSSEFSLENFSGTRFRVAVSREILLLDAGAVWCCLGIASSKDVSVVGFESHNTLTNAGKAKWRKETGLLSIWIAGMHHSVPSLFSSHPSNQVRSPNSGRK